MGSSLKICMVAEGVADIYPRLGLTSEWDTAAAHAILLGAGGVLVDMEQKLPIIYNQKESLLNPFFIAANGASPIWINQ
jgi:3'(2'), 5'-bisphosphate nucleotidase